MDNRSINKIIDDLVKDKGYPNVKLNKLDYSNILKQAHSIKYGKVN